MVPLNPEKVEIDFAKAKLPLSRAVIETGKLWYTQYDEGREFLNTVMKPYFLKYHNTFKKSAEHRMVEISSVPIGDIEKWAPCMQNIWQLPMCGEGATRALAVFVSYLGQIGVPEDNARDMFDILAERWGARKSNLFESYYRVMNVPTCQRLMSNDNRGFPKGVSIKNLGVCKPDIRCMNVPSPRYRTDGEANMKRLLKIYTTDVEKVPIEN